MNATTIALVASLLFTGYYFSRDYFKGLELNELKAKGPVIYVDKSAQVYDCRLVKAKGPIKLVRK